MPALRELQSAFAAALLKRTVNTSGLADERLERRFAVYRVNLRETFAGALQSAYPVLHAVMGAEEFRSLAWSYQRVHPSPSGNLFEVGRALPAFLHDALQDTARMYLHDLARLEWAIQEALVAADDEQRFDAKGLAALPASAHAGLRLTLHPSIRIVRSAHAVLDCWQAFQQRDVGAVREGDIRVHDERILVRRTAGGIELHLLDELEARCLEALLAGATLGAMTDAALEVKPEPDIGALLARWAGRGVITSWSEAERAAT